MSSFVLYLSEHGGIFVRAFIISFQFNVQHAGKRGFHKYLQHHKKDTVWNSLQ